VRKGLQRPDATILLGTLAQILLGWVSNKKPVITFFFFFHDARPTERPSGFWDLVSGTVYISP
jgi:hypothetical protein